MNGIELCARFSYITNKLRFCGPKEANKLFLDYFKSKDNEDAVEKSLKKFEGLLPYLSVIAEKNNLKPFDRKVVEAYWLGNELLKNCNDSDIKKVIHKLTDRGLPKHLGKEKIKNLPNGFLLHHNFNVYYVGVGMLTGSVDLNLQNMDNCRISSGRVIEIFPDKLIVAVMPLKKEDGKYILGEEEAKTIVYLPELLPNVKKYDHVALHWGFAPMILSKEQNTFLQETDEKILNIMNSISETI